MKAERLLDRVVTAICLFMVLGCAGLLGLGVMAGLAELFINGVPAL